MENAFLFFCYSSDKKTICLASNRGNLILFHPETPEVFQKIHLLNVIDTYRPTHVLYSGGFVWVSTIGCGIIRYQLSSGKIDRITYGGKGKENLLSHTDAYQLIPINNQNYLAATWNGYTLIMPDKENPENLTTEIYNSTVSPLYKNLESRMLSAYYDTNGDFG
ncbi:MAG: hypothetical protein LUE99_04960 [Bacteroides sp.]|nr:hypothetical protein [Bacteroides sp.]